jgi:Carboxypeptidase regulatory-like domain
VRTELLPLDVAVTPGDVTVIEIEVGNTADVIDGVTAHVEGVDQSWVHLPVPVLSLFPDSTGTLPIHIRFPKTTVVGDYLVVITVVSTIDATRHSTHDLWLHVDPIEEASLRLRPSVVAAGKRARYGAIVTNAGNVQTDFTMTAVDETRILDTSVVPLTLTVPPSTERVAEVEVTGKRPWFGQPVARTVTIDAETPTLKLRAVGTFNQKPRIPRGVLTALILAGIIALWSFIFLFGVGLLRQSDPTKAVADNFNTGGVQDVPLDAVAGSALGKVTAASTGDGLSRITVEAYRVTAKNGDELAASAGTADDGTYQLAGLLPGNYKFRFTADGFDETWYTGPPAGGAAGLVADQAAPTIVPVDPLAEVKGLDVTMSGQPGRIVGVIALPPGAPPGTVMTVSVQEIPAPPAAPPALGQRADPSAPPAEPPTITKQTTGPVAFEGLTTPGTYRITVQAPGFQSQAFTQELGGGADQVINTVNLGAASGSLSGTVRSSDGSPLGGVQVTITSGDIEKKAITPTQGNVGTYLVDGLDAPRTYVVTFAKGGFSGQTIALDLAAGAARTGVDGVLVGGTGTISGNVIGPDGAPLGGVQVVASKGDFTAKTSTLTTSGPGAAAGSYTLTDIPTPGNIAVTFSLAGYTSETRLVGFLVPTTVPNVSVQLRKATASIVGTVTGGGAPIAGATVELSDGLTSRTTATASNPNGSYVFTDVAPGSYTLTVTAAGFRRSVQLATLAAGDALTHDVAMVAGS